MSNLVCPVCKLECTDSVLLRSQECGHGVCHKCLGQRYPIGLTASAGVNWNMSPQHVVVCPVCTTGAPRDRWSDWSEERCFYEKAESIRRRVMMVLNADRECFAGTPLYNDFLENRDQVIFDLIYTEDPELRRDREVYLKRCEVENQKQTLESNERYKKRMEERIIDIVKREGVFYEKLKVAYGKQFTKAVDESDLVHPLRAEYNELFPGSGNGNSKLKAKIIQERTQNDMVNYLRQQMPTVMNDYEQKSGNSKERAVAGGYSKATVQKRTEQETWAFRLDVDWEQF